MSYISRKSIQKCQEFRSYKNITTTWKTSWQDKEPVPCVLRLVICYPNAHQYTRCTSNGKNHLTFFFCVLSKEFCQTRILMIQCLGMAWPNANITTILDPLFLPPPWRGFNWRKRAKKDKKTIQKSPKSGLKCFWYEIWILQVILNLFWAGFFFVYFDQTFQKFWVRNGQKTGPKNDPKWMDEYLN